MDARHVEAMNRRVRLTARLGHIAAYSLRRGKRQNMTVGIKRVGG